VQRTADSRRKIRGLALRWCLLNPAAANARPLGAYMLINVSIFFGVLFVGLLFFGNPESKLQLAVMITSAFMFSVGMYIISPLLISNTWKFIMLIAVIFYGLCSVACWWDYLEHLTKQNR